jgi:hypothetical protein
MVCTSWEEDDTTFWDPHYVAKWRADALNYKGLESPGHIFELATLTISCG